LSERQKTFEYIDHPADIGLRIYGKNLPSLFKNAAIAIYDVIGPSFSNKKQNIYRKQIVLTANSVEELLVSFLNEILFFAFGSHVIFQHFLIKIIKNNGETTLECDMAGKKFAHIKREVKAVTYHRVKIIKKDKYIVTDIIVDI